MPARKQPSTAISRSENMRRIRAKDTTPELAVRAAVYRLGYRGYRLNYAYLPGKPDLVLSRLRKAIFVNGCFWHGHDCKEGARVPRSNRHYWLAKIERNCQRDLLNCAALKGLGWKVLTVWECEIARHSAAGHALDNRLIRFLRAAPER